MLTVFLIADIYKFLPRGEGSLTFTKRLTAASNRSCFFPPLNSCQDTLPTRTNSKKTGVAEYCRISTRATVHLRPTKPPSPINHLLFPSKQGIYITPKRSNSLRNLLLPFTPGATAACLVNPLAVPFGPYTEEKARYCPAKHSLTTHL